MTRPADVYLLHGQGGAATSEGIDYIDRQINGWNLPDINAWVWDWGSWEELRDFADQRAGSNRLRFGIGYSMGGNGFTWVLGGVAYQGNSAPGVQAVVFDHVSFLDPTWASVLTPLTPPHLRAARHFKNHSFDPIGHGELKAISPQFPNLEVIDISTSHFLVDKSPYVQQMTLNTIWNAIHAPEATT